MLLYKVRELSVDCQLNIFVLLCASLEKLPSSLIIKNRHNLIVFEHLPNCFLLFFSTTKWTLLPTLPSPLSATYLMFPIFLMSQTPPMSARFAMSGLQKEIQSIVILAVVKPF